MRQLQVTVLDRRDEAQDIVVFELAAADGSPLPPYEAGSHIDVRAPDGSVRQYSLCGDGRDGSRYRIAVLRDPASRGGSVALHDRLDRGDVVIIGEPRNHFALVPSARTLLFAGGIGITPMLSMAYELCAASADFELHYCARSASRAAFVGEIAATEFADRVHLHLDDGLVEQRLDVAACLAGAEVESHLYVCGPAGFISHVVGSARELGWPTRRIHTEHFGAPAVAPSTGDRAFTIELSSTGRRLVVPPEATVIQVLARAGIEVLTSCEQGVCGTCVTRVLAGECDHRDLFLSDAEKARNDRFAPCCSRAKSASLVLDL